VVTTEKISSLENYFGKSIPRQQRDANLTKEIEMLDEIYFLGYQI
jgi:hypothetical protein